MSEQEELQRSNVPICLFVCVCHVGAYDDDDDDDDIILQHLAVGLCLHVGMKQSGTEVRFHR